jgi:tetratricopeptide (TPR) repeat protein
MTVMSSHSAPRLPRAPRGRGVATLALAGCLALASLAAPSLAHAMSVDEIMGMVQYNVPEDVIISAMESSGRQYSAADIQALVSRKAPASVIAKAKELAAPAAAPPPAAPSRSAPAAEEEPEPRSRFDDAEALGEDLDVVDDEGADVGGCPEYDKAKRDYAAEKYLTASYTLFDALQTNACPGKETSLEYQLAKSLEGLGLPTAAYDYYWSVVLKGTSTPLFKFALPRLAEIAAMSGDDYDLTRLTGSITPADYPRQSRPYLYYLAGRKAYGAGELSDAAVAFEQVPINHPLYPRAQYYQGIIAFEREKLRSAVKAFRAVIKAEPFTEDARTIRELEDLKDLSYMSIARIYFGQGGAKDFEQADVFYAAVDRGSSYWPQSLFERAWTRFYQGDPNETLGLLLTADSPFFRADTFVPETTYLRALVYFTLCELDEVERLMTIFESKYRPIRNEMKAEIDYWRDAYEKNRKVSFEPAYDKYFGAQAASTDTKFPVELFTAMLRNRDLAAMVRKLDLIEAEIETIRAQRAEWRDTVGAELETRLQAERAKSRSRAGRELMRAMTEQYRIVDGLLKDADVLRFEVADAQRADYMFKLQNPDAAPIDETPIDFATQTDVIFWPFNGEFWLDELAYYRYTEQGSCK